MEPMIYLEIFEQSLMKLNSEDDEFELYVDELFEQIPEEKHESLIPIIFKFFERNPLANCCAPGTLVHCIENCYPNYKEILKSSLKRVPSYNAILMVNRILNSKLSEKVRAEYTSLLQDICNDPDIFQELRKEANGFIEYQSAKNS